jgi:cell division protein FtsI/penicillin-binding protein 2
MNTGNGERGTDKWPLPRTINTMRARVAVLALLLSSCAFGAGVDPAAEPTTSSVAPTSTTTAPVITATMTTVDSATRAAAIDAARAFLDALEAADWEAAAAMVADPAPDLADTLARWSSGLALEDVRYSLTTETITDAAATLGVAATLTPHGFQPWHFATHLGLVGGDRWLVEWDPAILFPTLEADDQLEVRRQWQARGAILARDGTPLAVTAPTWTVGVVPGQITDLEALIAVLEGTAGIPGDVVRTAIAKPGVQPDWFVAVGVIPASDDAAASTLRATTGVLLRESTGRVSLTPDLAAHVVGSVAPITAERLQQLGPPYGPTDQVGVAGIEQVYETTLAGTPDARIVRVNRYGRELETLAEASGITPQDVTTTIDVTVQFAAERALDAVSKPAALVVVDTETSEVLAAVSRPVDGFDRAFLGTYPPGSTFKIVTATALLQAGMSPDDEVDCPAEVTLGGAHFPNAGSRDLGTISLASAFAESCNTTFTAQAVEHLTASSLAAVARAFGFDTDPDAGLPAATPRYPEPVDTAELAASAMGQGRVLVTPLEQASIAAAIAADGWMPPTLVPGPADRTRIPLDPAVAAQVADMMLLTVTDGTAGNARVPGEDVYGKTGSAEYDDQGDTHAWFVGYWGHLAIAVIVEDGGSGGQTSAPIAAALIRDLAGVGG